MVWLSGGESPVNEMTLWVTPVALSSVFKSVSLCVVLCVYRLIALVGDKYLCMRVMVCHSLPQARTHTHL